MGKVVSITVDGLDLWFNSSDHLPPHFHARRPGEWEIRVYFLECTEDHLQYDVKWPPQFNEIPKKYMKDLLIAITGNRDRLYEEYERKVCLS